MSDREPPVCVLITAEHASCSVPAEWAGLFSGQEAVLHSHRGWDPGTLELATALAATLQAPLLVGEVTRLLVDLNRSRGHPRHFSEFTRGLPAERRLQLIERYWRPHWSAYRERIEQAPAGLVHIACHSFTPELNGRRRTAEIGLLYDPARGRERAFVGALARCLKTLRPDLRVRLNYPYRGTANGMGQQHRRWFPEARLLSVELEINSALLLRPDWPELRDSVLEACRRTLRPD